MTSSQASETELQPSSARAAEWTDESLRDFLAAFNEHNVDRIMTFFSDDCVLETPRGANPWGSRYEGKTAVREILSYRFGWLPDMFYGDDEHWAAGNFGVSRWLLTGTSVDGERIEVRGCDLMELNADGLIQKKDSYWKIIQPAV